MERNYYIFITVSPPLQPATCKSAVDAAVTGVASAGLLIRHLANALTAKRTRLGGREQRRWPSLVDRLIDL